MRKFTKKGSGYDDLCPLVSSLIITELARTGLYALFWCNMKPCQYAEPECNYWVGQKLLRIFPYHLMEKSEPTFQPTEYICCCCLVAKLCLTLCKLLFMGFLEQEYWSGLPFPSPADHILSEIFTMTHTSWVALHLTVHSVIELCKPLYHNKAVIHEGRDN